MRRRLVEAAAVIVACLAIACVAAYGYLRRSLPDVEGLVPVSGLSSSVDVIRDADAIPHVFASNVPDALFGLGYVHAQDRLWQMELQRRIGFGRLSEVFGAVAIPQDRFLRTVGFGRAARAAWDRMPGWARDRVNAYVAGVNAFIATHHGANLPPEFTLLRFEPEPWSGPDVVVWVKMMAWDLSANYSFELLRDDLVRAVGTERMQQLMPPYPDNGLSILASGGTQAADTNVGHGLQPNRNSVSSADRQRDGSVSSVVENSVAALTNALSRGEPTVRDFLLGGTTSESLGSNNWVVDGTLSATGKPLLANDPHLSAKLPSTWYFAHLSAGDFDIIGATLPGTPAVALGRNRFIAWGATNVAADVEDLYRERLDETERFAIFRGTLEPITIVPETIQVKGGAPIRVDVRITRHGPIVSDAINANNAELTRGPKPAPLAPLALRWTALDPDDTTLSSFMKLNEARDWSQFTSALGDFVVPPQNFVYADINGHIGYYAPGRIPIRAGGDGSRPASGSSGDAEWTGWIPFNELPHLYDPPEHFIVTANQRPAPGSYPHMLGLEWPEPYRATRITELLRATPKLTPEDFARIQGDTVSLHAKALLPLLLRRVHPVGAADAQAVEMLRQWNGDARAGSAAPALFEAWFLQLAPAIAGDDLDPLVMENYAGRFSFVTRFLINTLNANDPAWCDDGRTPVVETCDETVTKALHEAVVDLTRRLGGNMARWRWDDVHRAVFPHQGFGGVPLLGRLLSRSVPNGGDWSTVNVGAVAADQPYEQHSVAGYREIIDLSPANDSRFVIDLGESGHPLSKHRDDFLQDWQQVRYRHMRTERGDIEKDAIGRLRLTPQ